MAEFNTNKNNIKQKIIILKKPQDKYYRKDFQVRW